MGCDVHMYVEHNGPARAGSKWGDKWSGWPRINPGRDYRMFGLLAGVRTGEAPVFPLRGLPEDKENMAADTVGDAFLYIADNMDDVEGFCTKAEAERYVKYGSYYLGDDKKRVSHPDWHSHGWLTASEFGQVLQKYEELYGPTYDPEYDALYASLQALEARGRTTRIVFWFDN